MRIYIEGIQIKTFYFIIIILIIKMTLLSDILPCCGNSPIIGGCKMIGCIGYSSLAAVVSHWIQYKQMLVTITQSMLVVCGILSLIGDTSCLKQVHALPVLGSTRSAFYRVFLSAN